MQRIALVNMPFASIYRPSIGLGLLKEALVRDGHHVDVFNFNLDFAEQVGFEAYSLLASLPSSLIGEWVFAAAFQDGIALTADGCYLSVNVSVAQLRLPGFTGRVREQLRASPIDPERVVIEITESQLVSDNEQIWDDLADLRTLGVRVAIDDYGTGYASLSYLRQPVIDIVKLDRRFLGSELSPDYAAAIRRRLDEVHPGQPLSGSPEPTAGGKGRGSRARGG